MEDKRLERLYDYTKFHIGIYLSAAGGLVTLIFAAAAGKGSFLECLVRWHWILVVSFGLVFVAGVVGAIVATSAIRSLSYDDFVDSPQGAYGITPWKGKYWVNVEHASFWLALICLAAGILSSQAVLNWLRDVGPPASGVCSPTATAGSVPMNIDWKLVIEGATFLSAAVGLFVGLSQYRRAQQWKRAEFLAQEMKELFADLKCTNALTMIDWAAREIPLGAFQTPPDSTPVAVDYVQQSDALRPHTLKSLKDSSATFPAATRSETSADAASMDGSSQFDRRQTLIRDCYDGLLDRLDRMGSYIERGLVSVEDLRPYIGYYVNDIAADANSEEEALWGASLLTYIIFYHFDGVVALFKAFRKDIDPDGGIFKGFVEKAGEKYRGRAEEFRDAAREEWGEMWKTLPGQH